MRTAKIGRDLRLLSFNPIGNNESPRRSKNNFREISMGIKAYMIYGGLIL